jgi:succinate dehydrogenase hydrophobic anchor subunit
MKKSKADLLWILQSMTGIALVLLLGSHWVAQHYLVSGGLRSYSQIVSYLKTPIFFVMELSSLIVVTTHALLGVHAIFIDIGLQPDQQLLLNVSLLLIGLFTVIYGVQLILQIVY